MDARRVLVERLADGHEHPLAELADATGLGPEALEDHCRALADWGLEPVRGATGLGLPVALDLLRAPAIEAALGPDARTRLGRLDVAAEVDSTNARLLAAAPPAAGTWSALLAEYQSAGRGRRGRSWIAPFAAGLCLSFGWGFGRSSPGIAPVSLVAGVAVLRALASQRIDGLALKWPNDVLCRGGKLGGILCEARPEAEGGHLVVIGIGLNGRLTPADRAAIRAAGGIEPAALADAGGAPCARAQLAAALLGALAEAMVTYEARGFAAFRDEWLAADALRGRAVRVTGPDRVREGIARGIDADGALALEVGGRIEPVTVGDVSLRAVA